jgi:nitrate/nitrite-specific signal transduction histidine kinase
MKKAFLVLVCAFSFILDAAGGLAYAQIADINSAINKAGRERMLSQRMAKAYFQLGLGVDTERSKQILETSISLFDRQLVELKNYAPTPEIKEIYLKLEKSWLAYKDALVGAAPAQANGKKVLDLSEEVLHLAQQGTIQLEKFSGTSTSHLVNVSGRQRMLSQRMAKFYQAAVWKVGSAQLSPEVDKARKEFSAILQELISTPNNSQALRDELELAKQQWFFFENALNQPPGADKTLPTNVATTSERILQTMENVVGLYEKTSR